MSAADRGAAERDAVRVVSVLCSEYGLDRDHLVALVKRDRSWSGVLDELLRDRMVDTWVAGDAMASALADAMEDPCAGPIDLDDALGRWRSVRQEVDAPASESSTAETDNGPRP